MTESVSKEKLLEQAKRSIDEGRIDRAIAEYQKIVALDPRDYRVQLRIAELHVRLKQIGDAVRTYQGVASAYADEGFYLKAVTVYKNILRLNPSLTDVNQRLAELYEKMGLAQDAIHQYQILSNVCEQKGDFKGILEIRRRIVSLDPTNVTSRIRLAEAYQVEGQDKAALQEYEVLAEQLKEGGSTEQLIELYEKILTRRPDNLELLRRLCRIYSQQHEYKKALRRMEASQGVVARDAELLEMQAEIYFRLNQMETAKGKWRELAELHQTAGANDAALAACERILTVAPDEVDDLAEMIEKIQPGALPTVKQRAETKRNALAKEEEAREALEAARQQAAEQISISSEESSTVSSEGGSKKSATPPSAGARPRTRGGAVGAMNVGEADQLERQAQASEGLAKMYQQMGLTEEAVAEFAKALEAYRRLLVAGGGGTQVVERVRELEAIVPAEVRPSVEASPVPQGKPAVTVKRAIPSPAAKPTPAAVAKSPPAQAPTPVGGDKKKRISFV